MILLVLCMAVGSMLAIRPAVEHDRRKDRVEWTGNIQVHHPDRTTGTKK